MDFEVWIILAYFGLLLGAGLLGLLRRYDDRRSEQKLVEEFSTSIVIGRRSGSLRTHKDIEKLYDGICSNQRALDRFCDLNKHLVQAHAKIVQKDKKILGEDVKDEEVKSLAEFTASAIDSLQFELRFKELPEIERNLLTDAASFADKKDVISVKNKLSELATAIKTREEELRRAEQWKTIGFALAALGFIATVVFGMLAL